MRLAAIDIGSNSIRCMIVDVPVGGRRVTLDEEREFARLGHGLQQTGRLDDAAMGAAVLALGRMLRIAGEYDVTHISAIATAAVRTASNGPAFVERVRRELGLEIEVISGEAEGRLALLSAVDSLALTGDITVVDIGGGSAEIVTAVDRSVGAVTSLPLGAVVVTEKFAGEDPLPKDYYKAMSRFVRTTLASGLDVAGPTGTIVGSGGTITTLAAMIAADREPGLVGVHGFTIGRKEITRLRQLLAGSAAKERAAMRGLSEGRVDIILAGAVVLDEILAALGAESIIVNARGMREGIVIDAVERERGVFPQVDRMTSVREFGRALRNDVGHAEQVTWIALSLFDELTDQLGLQIEQRPLLEAAALLHDAGYHISFEQHHKHSYHLIIHGELPGFTTSERRMIAAVARYHSGALPKPKHEAMAGLKGPEAETVKRLAALLRIADGLDRSRGRKVERVSAHLDERHLLIEIAGDADLDVEVYGAERKSDLFERVWGRSVRVTQSGSH